MVGKGFVVPLLFNKMLKACGFWWIHKTALVFGFF